MQITGFDTSGHAEELVDASGQYWSGGYAFRAWFAARDGGESVSCNIRVMAPLPAGDEKPGMRAHHHMRRVATPEVRRRVEALTIAELRSLRQIDLR